MIPATQHTRRDAADASLPLQQPEPDSTDGFAALGLAPELVAALGDLSYTQPTPIQVAAIPVLLQGRDLMGCAQTGTGKTAAFALPILQALRTEEPGRIRALVLVPTRELAIQVGRSFREYAAHTQVRSTPVYGGAPAGPQEMMLRYGVDVLVATPGRLKDYMWRGLVDFSALRYLVLDEADRMLDMGFIDAVREIVSALPTERQTMLFSATLDPEIRRLARHILRDPARIDIDPPATVAEGVDHFVVRVDATDKRRALEQLVRREAVERGLIFTRTKRGAHSLARALKQAGHLATSIHSDKTQSQRVAALEAFRSKQVRLLVATDIAARGLDVQGISHVINYDLPRSAEDYVHRVGRTARAGNKGTAISFVTPEDRGGLRAVEMLLGHPLATRNGGPPPSAPRERSAPARTRTAPVEETEPAAAHARSGRRRRRRRSTRPAAPTDRPRRDEQAPTPLPERRGWIHRVAGILGL